MRKNLLLSFTVMLAMMCGLTMHAQEAEGTDFQTSTQVFKGTLAIDLSAMGGEVTTLDDQSVILTIDTPTTCTVTLCNFSFGEMQLGDIVVDNVAMTQDGSNILLSGSKTGLKLAGGLMSADVTCAGTLDMTTQVLVLNIDVVTLGINIPVTFSGSPETQGGDDPNLPDDPQQTDEAVTYLGSISIPTGEDPIVVENQTLTITPTGDNKCTLTLYSFSFNGMNLGDITVEDVTVANILGVTTYTGSKEGLSLAFGMIKADVTCVGTENSDGELNMSIIVTLAGTDTIIPVTFNGQRATNAIHTVTDDALNTPTEYYRLDGMKIDANSLTPGLYIVRQGNKTHKTIIR